MSVRNQVFAVNKAVSMFGSKNIYKTFTQTLFASLVATSLLFTAQKAHSTELNTTDSVQQVTEQKLPLEGKTLRVGLSVNPPFITLNNTFGSPDGIEVDIIKELQRRTGFSIERERMSVLTYANLVEQDNGFDILAGSISLSPKYAERFEASPSYLSTTITLVANKAAKINSVSDIAYRTVAVPRSSNRMDFVGDLPKFEQKEVTSPFMAFFAVSDSKADAAFIVTPSADVFATNWSDEDLQVVGTVPNSQNDLGLLFKKDSPNNVYLQQAFLDMQADGTLDTILQKHMGAQHASL